MSTEPAVTLGRDAVRDLAHLASASQGLIGEIALSPTQTTPEGGTLGQLAATLRRLQRLAGVASAPVPDGAAILEAALAGGTDTPIGTVVELENDGRQYVHAPDHERDGAPWRLVMQERDDEHREPPLDVWESAEALIAAGAIVVSVPMPVGRQPASSAADELLGGPYARAVVPLMALAAELDAVLGEESAITLSLGASGEPRALVHGQGAGSTRPAIDALRLVADRWPGAIGGTVIGDGKLYVDLRPEVGGRDVEVSVCLWPDEQAEARAWLVERGVEVAA
jgi:hypothetical protein